MKFGGGLFGEFPKMGGLLLIFSKNKIVAGKDYILETILRQFTTECGTYC